MFSGNEAKKKWKTLVRRFRCQVEKARKGKAIEFPHYEKMLAFMPHWPGSRPRRWGAYSPVSIDDDQDEENEMEEHDEEDDDDCQIIEELSTPLR